MQQQQQQQQPHKEDSDEAADDARVREQRTMIPESAAASDGVPRTMRVKPCLQRANLRDAVVRTKKQAKKNYV